MGRKFTHRNEEFTCIHCDQLVPPASATCRNHCPHCLYSKHVDVMPGDRASTCGGTLVPVGVVYTGHKGYQIVHECDRCHDTRRNVALLDDEMEPDSLEAVLALMAGQAYR